MNPGPRKEQPVVLNVDRLSNPYALDLKSVLRKKEVKNSKEKVRRRIWEGLMEEGEGIIIVSKRFWFFCFYLPHVF